MGGKGKGTVVDSNHHYGRRRDAPQADVTKPLVKRPTLRRLHEARLSEPIAGSGDFGNTQLVWTEGRLIAVQSPSGIYPGRAAPAPRTRAYVIDPKTGEVPFSAYLGAIAPPSAPDRDRSSPG